MLEDGLGVFGTQVKEKATFVQYGMHMNALRSFCVMKGDFESLAILLENAPSECPSMNHQTLIEYFKYRASKPGELIRNTDGEILKDTAGNQILSVGGWNAPVNIKQCASAITAVHKARKQSGQYQDSCVECITKFQTSGGEGCRKHRAVPRFERTGTLSLSRKPKT